MVYQCLREAGLEMPLSEFRIMQEWNNVLGKTVSKYTKDLRIYNQVLYVEMTSAALRNEIMMRRASLVETLNERVGAQVICSIVVR